MVSVQLRYNNECMPGYYTSQAKVEPGVLGQPNIVKMMLR